MGAKWGKNQILAVNEDSFRVTEDMYPKLIEYFARTSKIKNHRWPVALIKIIQDYARSSTTIYVVCGNQFETDKAANEIRRIDLNDMTHKSKIGDVDVRPTSQDYKKFSCDLLMECSRYVWFFFAM